jgi:hypothetical protein
MLFFVQVSSCFFLSLQKEKKGKKLHKEIVMQRLYPSFDFLFILSKERERERERESSVKVKSE